MLVSTKEHELYNGHMRFSQRKGLSPIKTALQRESMDDDLRTGLWNAYILAWPPPEKFLSYEPEYLFLFRTMWHDFFKMPIDKLPDWEPHVMDQVRAWFFRASWAEVYDFVEFLLSFKSRDDHKRHCQGFVALASDVLESEKSAYRIAGTQLVEITDDNELASIEEAISISGKFAPARDHLKTAAGFLFDRKSPDYRNSIKESISAVEAAACIITENTKATLGQALAALEQQGLHSALSKGFANIYGYTSDADGIRHAMLCASTCDFHDAKYMLVACAGFINFLVGKSSTS